MEDASSPPNPGPSEPTLPPRTDDPTAAAGRRTLADVALGTIVGCFVWILSMVASVIIIAVLIDRARDEVAGLVTLITVATGFAAGVGFTKWRVAARIRKTTRRRRAAVGRSKCPSCAYSLLGLPEPRCPECGERFTRSEFAELRAVHPPASAAGTRLPR